MATFYTIKLRRGLAADWTAVNPVLAEGETGWELDTRNFKQGDGSTAWNDLEYIIDGNDRLPDVALEDDNQILLTFGGQWVVATMPTSLPDATGQPDGKTLITESEEWVIGDAAPGGDPNAMLSAPPNLLYTYDTVEPTDPTDGDIWTDPDSDPPGNAAEIRAVTAAQLVAGAGVDIDPVGDTLVISAPAGDGMDLSGPDDYKFGLVTNALDVLPAGWSFVRAGAGANQLTFKEGNGRGVLMQVNAYTYNQFICRSLPAAFVSALIRFDAIPGSGNEGAGILLRDSASGKHAHLTTRADGSTHITFLAGPTGAVGTDLSVAAWSVGPQTGHYMKIVRNSATSWDWYWGASPQNMFPLTLGYNVPAASQGFTPDQVGFGFLCLGGGFKHAALDYIKFT